MIKGCQRKILLVQGGETSLFESAYFVLKKNAESEGRCHTDMLKEANRIIEKSLPANAARMKRLEKLKRKLKYSAFFILGVIAGGGTAALSLLPFLLG